MTASYGAVYVSVCICVMEYGGNCIVCGPEWSSPAHLSSLISCHSVSLLPSSYGDIFQSFFLAIHSHHGAFAHAVPLPETVFPTPFPSICQISAQNDQSTLGPLLSSTEYGAFLQYCINCFVKKKLVVPPPLNCELQGGSRDLV